MGLILLLFLVAPAWAADTYVFTSFRGNGESGVYFAISQDGHQWTELNEGKPLLRPSQPGMLMRDPFLTRGRDGTYHLLWTWGWSKSAGGRLQIGYASSTDLIHWSEQRAIPVMENEPGARNAWAPEMVWDRRQREWLIYWSSTIPGRFPATDASGDDGYNHRVYAMRSKDMLTFTPAKLYFDPGFNCIDATIASDGAGWRMFFKDERKTPLMKCIRYATAATLDGPWTGVSEPITRDWVEGPSALRIGAEWLVYFDHYTEPHYYGAYRTHDWKVWEEVSSKMRFPPGHRHGTALRIPEKDAASITRYREPQTARGSSASASCPPACR